jgi:hypothetical protein
MNPTFRFYLRPDTTSYYQSMSGAVSITTTAVHLDFDPVGWKEINLQYKRSPEYSGIFRELVVPITFVKDGAAILRHVYYSQGVDGACILEIYRKKATDETYELFYSGDVDFGTSADEDLNFQVNLLDKGLPALFKAYKNTPQKIPLLDADAHRINFDGITLQATYPFGTLVNPLTPATPWQDFHSNPVGGAAANNTPQWTWETYSIEHEGDINPGLTLSPAPTAAIRMDSSLITSAGAEWNNFHYKASKGGKVVVTLNQKFSYQNNPNTSGALTTAPIKWAFKAIHWDSATNTIAATKTLWAEAGFTPPGQGRTYLSNPATGTATFANVLPDDRIYVVFQVTAQGPFTLPWQFDATFYDQEPAFASIEIKPFSRLDASQAKAYSLFQLWQKMILSIAGSGYTAASTLLTDASLLLTDNSPFYTHVTCGDALRNLNQDTNGNASDPAIKTTLDELHATMQAVYMAGIGAEGTTARIERQSYFFNNNVVTATLSGLVKNFRRETAREYLFSSIKAGYQKQSYDATNGRDEFNSEVFFSVPSTAIPAQKDLQSQYRADMYGIEFTRINLSNKKTTDSASDNDSFLVEANSTLSAPVTNGPVGYNLARLQNNTGNSASGLIDSSTAFNLSLSPMRSMFRNAPLLSTAVYPKTIGYVNFQTSDKNEFVVSKLSSGVGQVGENSSIPVSALNNPLFLPIRFIFETPVPVDIPALIEGNPYGRINFNWRNPATNEVVTLGGFIEEVGINPANNATYTYKLLACPDTDVSKFLSS